jgi:hypothetical protein
LALSHVPHMSAVTRATHVSCHTCHTTQSQSLKNESSCKVVG